MNGPRFHLMYQCARRFRVIGALEEALREDEEQAAHLFVDIF